MTTRRLLRLQALVSLGFAVVDGLIPELSGAWFGLALDRVGTFLARSFAAGFLGFGILCFSASRRGDPQLQHDVVSSLLIADSAALLVALAAQVSGLMNALSWLIVTVWLVLVAGCVYVRFVRPQDG